MTTVHRYKEIFFGLGLGFVMWVVDAAMHVQMGTEVDAPKNFAAELFAPGATQFLFRVLFLLIASAFGFALWRANWRERELRALEEAIIAFHRQLDSPAMRIVSHVRMLQSQTHPARDELTQSVLELIGEDARAIDELARQYIRFSEQVMAGRTAEAIDTLRGIVAWQATNAPHRTPSTTG